ncbi:hypothetical protein PLICRDRAFT_176931 [Plicaturopsis crispa FD-325 SS-3]|nr:hypothetical protein PLICRDRAFT_176931 [Plicaturopsis crispa FD-325 SS-3]
MLIPEVDLATVSMSRFRPNELPILKVLSSVEESKKHVELRSNNSGKRWDFYPITKTTVAVFTHAAYWLRGTPSRTGNFVKVDDPVPSSIVGTKIYREPHIRCQVTYDFDITRDRSLENCSRVVDELASLQDKIGGDIPRRDWKSAYGGKFQMTCPLLEWRTQWNANSVAEGRYSYDVHPDILQAVADSTKFIPSLSAPARLLALEDGKLVDLETTDFPSLGEGDVVWMSFSICIVVTPVAWWPEYNPQDIVRIARYEPDPVGSSNVIQITRTRPPVRPRVTPLTLGDANFLDDASCPPEEASSEPVDNENMSPNASLNHSETEAHETAESDKSSVTLSDDNYEMIGIDQEEVTHVEGGTASTNYSEIPVIQRNDPEDGVPGEGIQETSLLSSFKRKIEDSSTLESEEGKGTIPKKRVNKGRKGK